MGVLANLRRRIEDLERLEQGDEVEPARATEGLERSALSGSQKSKVAQLAVVSEKAIPLTSPIPSQPPAPVATIVLPYQRLREPTAPVREGAWEQDHRP